MSAEERYFPIDIFAIKRYGIARWQREFFWPIADQDFVSLCRDIETAMRFYIENSPPEIGDILIVKYNLVMEYWHFFHALGVLNGLARQGLHPLYSETNFWYQDIIEETLSKHPYGFVRRSPLSDQLQFQRNIVSYGKGKLRACLKALSHNTALGKCVSLWRNDLIHTFGIPSALVTQYLRTNPRWAVITMPVDWSCRSSLDSGRPARDMGELVRSLVREMSKTAERHGIILNEAQQSYLLNLTRNHLEDADRSLAIIKEKASTFKIARMCTPTLHAPIQRLIALAVRHYGGKIITFTHGGHVGLFDSPTPAMNEFALADECIVYTKGCLPLFEKIKKQHPILRGNQVRLDTLNSTFYSDLRKRYEKDKTAYPVRKVMLVGCPQNPWRKPQASASLGLMHLDFELRLIQTLQEAGFSVIYKAHPDRLSEIEGIFDKITTVITEPFEQVTHLADAFIFGNIRTSTFPVAICTNKPIVACMLKDEFPPPFPEAMELLKKRCRFVFTEFDDRNRIVFNKKDLYSAVTENNLSSNMEFAQQYLFSSNL